MENSTAVPSTPAHPSRTSISVLNPTLPDEIKGKPISKLDDLTNDDKSIEAETVRAWHEAVANVTSKATPILSNPAKYPPKRFLKLHEKSSRDGMYTLDTQFNRPQRADSLIKNLYGEYQKRENGCTGCQKGNGPYSGYVTLTAMSTVCANCHYGGTATKCSLSARKKSRAREDDSEEERPAKRGPTRTAKTSAEKSFCKAIRDVPAQHLRIMGKAMIKLADELDFKGDDESE